MRDTIDMAREARIDVYGLGHDRAKFIDALKHFECLVRADERTRFTVPDAITDNSESPDYRAGWNDCRAEMLKGQS